MIDKNIGEVVKFKQGQTEIKSNDGKIYQIKESGIDGDGNKTFIAEQPAKWITNSILMLPDGKLVSIDENERCWECHNIGKYRIVFDNTHPEPLRRMHTPQTIVVEPNQRKIIPHCYYTVYAGYIGNTSDVCNFRRIFGDEIGKGK